MRGILVDEDDFDEHHLHHHPRMDENVVDLGYRVRDGTGESFHVTLGICIPLEREKPRYLLMKRHARAWCVRIADEYLAE